ncbi:MAG: cation:proton antiporter, partial [Bacteroidota bacterium]
TALLGVIAIDDALGIILFTVAVAFAGGEGLSAGFIHASLEIGGAILLGTALGSVVGWFGRLVEQEDLRLPIILGSIILVLGLSQALGLSLLLAGMTLGFTSKLWFGSSREEHWLRPMKHIQEVVFVTLFTLAGTHFQPTVFVDSLGMILTYTIARVIGKTSGAWVGTRLTASIPEVHRYLGLGLLPQAGIALGLALVAAGTPGLRDFGPLIVNTVIGTTIVFELSAPLLTKHALVRAGDIE